jgi:hypothetical protein
MTNGVYLAMKRLESPGVQSKLDRFLTKSKRKQLPPRDNPMLPSRQPSQLSLSISPLPRACLSLRGHIPP